MDKRKTFPLLRQLPDNGVPSAADPPNLQSQPPTEVTKSHDAQGPRSSSKFKPAQQVKRKRCSDCDQQDKPQFDDPNGPDRLSEDQQPLLIHGLSAERYRVIYNSVLQPSVLAALSSADSADYVSQVMELKQRLWTELSRPRLEETVMEDGRVEVKEIFDLT